MTPPDDPDDRDPRDGADRDPAEGSDGDPGDGRDRDPGEGSDRGADRGPAGDPDDTDEWEPRDWDERAPAGGDPPEESDDDGPPGFVEALVDLLREVADAEDGRSRSREGFDRFGGASVDFSITAGSLTDHFGPPPLDDLDDDEETGPYVTTRETGEGCLVVADLQGVTGEDLSTGIDDDAGELVVSVDGEVVGRVPLDDPALEVTDARLNNEILEVRLAHEQ